MANRAGVLKICVGINKEEEVNVAGLFSGVTKNIAHVHKSNRDFIS